jgi:hypothetical protein
VVEGSVKNFKYFKMICFEIDYRVYRRYIVLVAEKVSLDKSKIKMQDISEQTFAAELGIRFEIECFSYRVVINNNITLFTNNY